MPKRVLLEGDREPLVILVSTPAGVLNGVAPPKAVIELINVNYETKSCYSDPKYYE